MRLWAFGIYVGHEQGMYLNRYEFVPRRAMLTDTWTPTRLERRPRSVDRELLSCFLDWVCEYEEWVKRPWDEAIAMGFCSVLVR